MSIKEQEKCSNFSAKATNNLTITLDSLAGQNVILYFYPRDNTPGCSLEGRDFAANYATFKQHNYEIFGISRDSLASHEKFKTKMNLPFELISDDKEELCQLFDVIKMLNMFGKKIRGVERSTFLINQDGVVEKIWRNVKVKTHVNEVLAYIKG